MKKCFEILLLSVFAVTAFAADKCVKSQVDSKCYLFFDYALAYETAHKYCTDRNAHLVSIHNVFAETEIQADAQSRLSDDYWIGYTDYTENNHWKWEDGTASNYTNWANGFPMKSFAMDCAAGLLSTGKWYNTNCDEIHPFICEVPIGGVCPNGWAQNFEYNSCYHVIVSFLTWDKAEDQCLSMSSHLASIHSADENEYVSEFVEVSTTLNGSLSCCNSACYASTWIGLRFSDTTRVPYWSDGTPVTYTNWAAAEPDNQNGDEYCTEFIASKYFCHGDSYYRQWDDLNCAFLLGTAVCKKTPGAS